MDRIIDNSALVDANDESHIGRLVHGWHQN